MKFINLYCSYRSLAKRMIQKKGKFSTAFSHLSKIVCNFKLKLNSSPLRVLRRATGNVQPIFYMKASKRGRQVKQSPMFFLDRREGLIKGLHMLFKDFDKKISTNFVRRTTYEIYDAYRKRGFIYQRTVAWHKLGFNSKFNRFIKKKKKFNMRNSVRRVRVRESATLKTHIKIKHVR